MAKNLEGKVSTITVNIPYVLYKKFRLRATSEGYSMQKAIYLLVEHYTNDTLLINNKDNT